MSRIKCNTIGYFHVDEELVFEQPELVSEIFAAIGFVPYHVEYQPWPKLYRYEGISPEFQPVELGQPIPGYEIWVKTPEFSDGLKVALKPIKQEVIHAPV